MGVRMRLGDEEEAVSDGIDYLNEVTELPLCLEFNGMRLDQTVTRRLDSVADQMSVFEIIKSKSNVISNFFGGSTHWHNYKWYAKYSNVGLIEHHVLILKADKSRYFVMDGQSNSLATDIVRY